MLLKLKPSTNEVKDMYDNHGTYHVGDSGLDLFVPEDIIIKGNSLATAINMKLSCEAIKIDIKVLEAHHNILSLIENNKNSFDDLYSKELVQALKNAELKKINCSYYLYPRSSISKTPLRMSNSTGIIDAGYRGEIIATVDNLSSDDYTVKKGTRMFQICDASLDPIELEVVDTLSDTTRGDGGFGSTG